MCIGLGRDAQLVASVRETARRSAVRIGIIEGG
jgi:hypothetical protein